MSETTRPRAIVPGSAKTLPAGATIRGAASPERRLEVLVVLRPRRAEPLAPGSRMGREAFASQRGAAAEDALAVQRFATEAGLLVTGIDLARRAVDLQGTVAGLERAFGVRLHDAETASEAFVGREGEITVPAALGGIVTGVFGLDTRRTATPKFRLADAAVARVDAPSISYTPPQLAAIYGFPTGVDGTGQTIGLIELGGGFTSADLQTYFTGLGLATPAVTAVPVGTGANAPTGDPNGPDTEVMLDIEVAGAVAPGAKIVVYFAENTDAGFLSAVTTAVHDTANAPQILSISWGGPESSWTAQARKNFDDAFADAATLGISVFVAAGDSGSTDGVTDGEQHVDFPASSPNVVACGGTHLVTSGTAITSETVWNDNPGGGGGTAGATGGGVSAFFPVPAYQQGAGVPVSADPGGFAGRGVPDVAGCADPATGYAVRSDGTDTIVGGTSAVAPLYAGLTALINQSRGAAIGFPNATFYAQPAAFRDVVSGSNGAYDAGPGWDACTGLGSPHGTALLAAFPTASPPAAPTTPPVTTAPTAGA